MRALTARTPIVPTDDVREPTARLLAGPLEIDLEARQAAGRGRPLGLTAKEFDLLAYLAVRPGRVFSRDQLLRAVWHSAAEWQQAATVTEHIRRLRGKIEVDPKRPRILRTVRGAGYRLDLPGAGRPLVTSGERSEDDEVADQLRALLSVRSVHGAAGVLHETIRRLGGTVVAASGASADALPTDASLGEGPPLVVEVDPGATARQRLERLVPRLVADAKLAARAAG